MSELLIHLRFNVTIVADRSGLTKRHKRHSPLSLIGNDYPQYANGIEDLVHFTFIVCKLYGTKLTFNKSDDFSNGQASYSITDKLDNGL
ncbi:hypothetical protein TNCV_4818101 [Trichonephila clavipes]|nr:hypothetical protein TNCV_4818101 [Trichonephila clavipes]